MQDQSTPRSSACHMPAAAFDDVSAAAAWCTEWVSHRVRCHKECGENKPAAVFDIDATLVDGNERLEAVCRLFHACRGMGVTPFLVTARSEEGRGFTENQMHKLGIVGYKRLFMHPPDVQCTTSGAGKVKLRGREKIKTHGYTVLLNAGDAWHDHIHPIPQTLVAQCEGHRPHVFVTDDGVAHLKLPHTAR